MEVLKKATLFTFLVILSACAKNEQVENFTKSTSTACEDSEVKGQYIVNWKDGSRTVEHAVSEKEFIAGFLEKNKDHVSFAEPDYMIRPRNIDITPAATPPAANWGATRIHAEDAWTKNIKGSGIKVAVVDTGIDITHKQLKNQLDPNLAELNGVRGVDDDKNGFVDDIYGWNFFENSPVLLADEASHGTHVAGVILAEHATGSTQGIAPEAKLITSSFLGVIDNQGNVGGTTSDAILAIQYAASRGAKIINASWGGSACSKSLQKSMTALETSEVLVIVAAGNSGQNLSYSPEYPAAFHLKNQITVAALDPTGYMASFSNYGSLVDLLAPGVDIESTVPHSLYDTMSGTSMAAPFVTGAAALLWSKKPSATAAEIKAALLNSLENLSSHNSPRGKLRIDQALTLIN